MKSPFPGMDPYLERRWQDIHQRLCTYACDQLNERLGKGLVARLGERLIVQSEDEPPRAIYPDVRVIEQTGFESAGQAVAVLEEVAEPLLVPLPDDPELQSFIDIAELDSGRLITSIEFLSQTNKKSGPGRKHYKQKQKELIAARVNLVEIDLLRYGRRAFVIPRHEFPESARAPYYATIVRARRRRVELYPISLRKPLPSLRIPLRPTDVDVVLRLQPLFDMAYRNGRYDQTDYSRDCSPALAPEDQQWATELLTAAGRR